MAIHPDRMRRMTEGALAYALADKSDPFAYGRALAHTANGVASIDGDKNMFYSAERGSEERKLPTGETFQVTVYRNATRP